MPSFRSDREGGPEGLSALAAIIEKSVRGMDHKLGYRGGDRFVLFYYEPRGEEVIWRDSHSYGFSTGAGPLFLDELAPVADVHQVNVGHGGSVGVHALLIDRGDGRAYFVERDEAVRFLTAIAEGRAEHAAAAAASSAVPPIATLATLREITHESIAKVAYQIWERHGKLEGRALQDWLQAKAQLTAERWASRRPP